MRSFAAAVLLSCALTTQGYSFVSRPNLFTSSLQCRNNALTTRSSTPRKKTQLSMIDQNMLIGGGVAVASFAFGIGIVVFTEIQGERARQRGGGLSDDMSTKLSGMYMEDVEVSSVSDLGSLTDQLEAALKESKGEIEENLEISEETKKRVEEELDDGW